MTEQTTETNWHLVRTTRGLRSDLVDAVKELKPGQKIRITHTVRVGSATWPAVVTGTFREVRSLVTGLATDRYLPDDIIVPTIHFTKENGEHSSVALDENCQLELLSE